jgi:hypothetical protein
MSGFSDLDGEVGDLPGRLAYFDGEEPGERYILARRDN